MTSCISSYLEILLVTRFKVCLDRMNQMNNKSHRNNKNKRQEDGQKVMAQPRFFTSRSGILYAGKYAINPYTKTQSPAALKFCNPNDPASAKHLLIQIE